MMVEMADYVRLLRDIVEIYSPSGYELEVSKRIEKFMLENGFENVRVDAAGNVIGEVGSGSPTILFCGHMDTVPGKLPVILDGELLYGRGAVDAKSPLAALIAAASKLRDIRGRIIVAAVVDEEGYGKGINEIIKSNIEADYAVFGEPSNLYGLTVGYRGKIGVKISCRTGHSGHSSAPWAYRNAIEELFNMYLKLKLEIEKVFSSSVAVCLTRISGGESHNIVPSSCEAYIDVRTPKGCNVNECVMLISKFVREYALDSGLDVDILYDDVVEPYEVDLGSPIVKAFSRAVAKILNKPIKLMRKTGTGDLNVYARSMGVPSVSYGPGDSRLSHTENEYVRISDYIKSIEVLVEAVKTLCILHS
jgi:LysW-gamma-L-lysine carboxypeptidase